MTTLSDEKAALVRRVVELAPDRALGQIEAVLNDARGDPAMAAIRHMVEREMGDRQVREAVFAPLSPWLKSQAPGLIGALWRGLHALTPLQIAMFLIAQVVGVSIGLIVLGALMPLPPDVQANLQSAMLG